MKKHQVAELLRNYAQKVASGSPDRMTVAYGQGGITTHTEQPKKDPGEAEVKIAQPGDGTIRTSSREDGAPDRMTVADGQGGITTQQAAPKKDPGEDDVKTAQPADGTMRKSSSDRIAGIRNAISSVRPDLVQGTTGQASGTQLKTATTSHTAPARTATPLDLSQDMLAKIASAALASEEGVGFIFGLLEKQAGAAAAQAQLAQAIEAASLYNYTDQVKSAAFHEIDTRAQTVYNDLIAMNVTEDDADMILKQAALHQEALLELDHPMLKAAYAQGASDGAAMEQADEGQEGAPPPDQAIPQGGEKMSEEDVIHLIEQAMEAGLISKEDVEQALNASAGGEQPPAEAGAEGGDAPAVSPQG